MFLKFKIKDMALLQRFRKHRDYEVPSGVCVGVMYEGKERVKEVATFCERFGINWKFYLQKGIYWQVYLTKDYDKMLLDKGDIICYKGGSFYKFNCIELKRAEFFDWSYLYLTEREFLEEAERC